MTAIAAALARRLCQMFDSGGESQRSARARHASALFQILHRDDPEYLAEQQKCDANPVAYLEMAERKKDPERCPSCFGSDEDYQRGFYRCSDPWHADDHLRKPR